MEYTDKDPNADSPGRQDQLRRQGSRAKLLWRVAGTLKAELFCRAAVMAELLWMLWMAAKTGPLWMASRTLGIGAGCRTDIRLDSRAEFADVGQHKLQGPCNANPSRRLLVITGISCWAAPSGTG